MTSDIWESDSPAPLMWLATASVAFVVHLAMLQVGITAYQNTRGNDDAPPATETKIIATALQIEGTDVPAPEQLEATTPPPDAATPATPATPEAPQALTPQTLTATAPVTQTLQATVAPAPVAQTAQTLSPVAAAPEPLSADPITPSAADAHAQSLAPSIAPAQAASDGPLNQPGVAPIASAPAPPPAAVAPTETLETAALDAPVLEALPDPEPEAAPEPAAPEPIALAEPEPEPEPEPAPEPLPDLAASLPPQGGEAQAGIASANAPTQTTEQAQNTYDTVLDFLRSFDGGDCFAALPVLAEDGSFRFETFASSRADLTRFRQALEIETGTLPGTVMKPVSQPQCQALPFVTAAARYPEFQLYFDLSARDIASGEILSGRLGNTSGGVVSLLLIDDDGVVQDLSSFLKFRPGYAGFDIPMTLQGSPVQTQQLLMALSTRSRLRALRSLSGGQAEDVFPKLALEILLQGGGEDVALVAFSVR